MRAEDIEAWAARVEAATGADRELDARIACACNIRPAWAAKAPESLYPYRDGHVSLGKGGAGWEADPYTASIDAAMSLVPEGWHWTLFHEGVVSFQPDVAFCSHPDHNTNGLEVRADAATPALALTAAALRARAHAIRRG